MKIMMVDPGFLVVPYDREICSALATAGHEVIMVGPALKEGETWNVASVQHIQIAIPNLFEPILSTGTARRVQTALRHILYGLRIQAIQQLATRLRPDVIHFQWCLTPLAELYLLKKLKRRARVVLTVHDTNPFNGSRVSSFLTLALPRLMSRFDHVIVHSETAALELTKQGIAQSSLSVVPHGLLPIPPRKDNPCAQGSRPEIVFLLFGHIKHYKGTDILIRAAGLLPEQIKTRCRFIVAGQLSLDLSGLLSLCDECDVRAMFDFIARHIPEEELSVLFESADVFVFPYREIQSSGVLTLALQTGNAILASDIGIFRDMIIHGASGLLVPPEDPVALADAIIRLAENSDERIRLGREARRLCTTVPSWDTLADATVDAYMKASH